MNEKVLKSLIDIKFSIEEINSFFIDREKDLKFTPKLFC